MADFILGGSKITADGDCSHEIKRCLLLRRKVVTNLDSILKSRDITLPTSVHLVKVMVLLRICLTMQGIRVQSLVRELRFPHAAVQPERPSHILMKSPCTL